MPTISARYRSELCGGVLREVRWQYLRKGIRDIGRQGHLERETRMNGKCEKTDNKL